MLSTNALLEALPVAVYTTDAAGRITFFNQAAADLWGYRPELGSMWCGSWRIYCPDGTPLPHDECPMAIALKEGRIVRGVEAVAERPDGTRVPFAPYPTPIKDESGKIMGGINVLVDISRRKEDEAVAARLAAIVASSDDAIISKTLEGIITSWNTAATRIFGYEADEMIGQHITRIIPPELRHEEDDIISRLKRGERIDHFETVRMAKNGRRVNISVTISPLRNQTGQIIGASKVARDVTRMKETEAAAAKLAAIVTSSDDAIISKTLDGIVTSWNDGAARIFGYEADEMIGQHITRIIPPELHAEEEQILARLKTGERIEHYETARVAKDGRRVDISLTISPLRNEAGPVIGASTVSRDISEKKQAEKLKQLLIEELNHRVKNTLATVQAIASQSLSRARNHQEFVTGFTGRIQALSKLHTLLTQADMQGTDMTDLVISQVRLGSADDERVSVSGPFLFLSPLDAGHLGMVLHELATNARKYGALSTPTGRVSVSWELQTNGKRSLVLKWAERGGPKVRAPLSRGFGMTLIEQTVRVRGGEASLHFAEEGLRCEIEWPLAEQPRGAMSTTTMRFGESSLLPAPATPSLRGKRILIVEDEPVVAMDMQAILSDAGCTVIGPVGTVTEALEILQHSGCDAALVDVNLQGTPIDKFLPALKAKDIPYAFVTGYGAKVLSQTFEETVTLNKPFSAEQLLAMVEVLLYLRGAGGDVVPLKKRSR